VLKAVLTSCFSYASQADSASAWDFASVLSDLGQTVSEGITGLADNISDFVADLASAFDAGWDEEEQNHGYVELQPGAW
jgi:hypothetical protein